MTVTVAALGGISLGLLAGMVLGYVRLRRADRAAEREQGLG